MTLLGHPPPPIASTRLRTEYQSGSLSISFFFFSCFLPFRNLHLSTTLVSSFGSIARAGKTPFFYFLVTIFRRPIYPHFGPLFFSVPLPLPRLSCLSLLASFSFTVYALMGSLIRDGLPSTQGPTSGGRRERERVFPLRSSPSLCRQRATDESRRIKNDKWNQEEEEGGGSPKLGTEEAKELK